MRDCAICTWVTLINPASDSCHDASFRARATQPMRPARPKKAKIVRPHSSFRISQSKGWEAEVPCRSNQHTTHEHKPKNKSVQSLGQHCHSLPRAGLADQRPGPVIRSPLEVALCQKPPMATTSVIMMMQPRATSSNLFGGSGVKLSFTASRMVSLPLARLFGSGRTWQGEGYAKIAHR